MKFKTFEFSASVEAGIYMIGIGWWGGCTPLQFSGWFNFIRCYIYNGRWLSFRIGPFFYCIGPY